MPSHKVANAFIKKYNAQFAIKGYSKLKLQDKLNLIKSKVKSVPKMKKEWDNIMKDYKKNKSVDSYFKKKPNIDDEINSLMKISDKLEKKKLKKKS